MEKNNNTLKRAGSPTKSISLQDIRIPIRFRSLSLPVIKKDKSPIYRVRTMDEIKETENIEVINRIIKKRNSIYK